MGQKETPEQGTPAGQFVQFGHLKKGRWIALGRVADLAKIGRKLAVGRPTT